MVKLQISRMISLFLTGLIAGTFFYGTLCVIPAFYDVPSELHIGFRTALMRYNAFTVMSVVILAIIAMVFYTWQIRKIKIPLAFCLIALTLTIISLVITRAGSVPINLQIKTWDRSAPPVNWLKILATWDFYNLIRTITSIGSFICLLLADFWLVKVCSSRFD